MTLEDVYKQDYPEPYHMREADSRQRRKDWAVRQPLYVQVDGTLREVVGAEAMNGKLVLQTWPQ